jgi:hypothetical protein
MAKNTFYFQHDYNCSSDPKIQALLYKYGSSGYGIYWRIVEMLHEIEGNKLPFKDYIMVAIASNFKDDIEYVKHVVKYMIEECELFNCETGFFFSDRVIENISRRDTIREARSKAGKRSGEVRQLTNVEQNETKESKEKESKGNESNKKKDEVNYVELLNYFNHVFQKENRIVNDAVKSKFNARIKEGYTIVDIRQAMKGASVDQFHRDNSFKYCTLEYFSRPQTLDKYAFRSKNNTYIATK